MDQQEPFYLRVDDIMMSGNFNESLSGIPHSALAQITSYYQEKIAKDIDDMVKHFAETLSIQEITPNTHKENCDLNKYKSLIKIQNIVTFITNLIHTTE